MLEKWRDPMSLAQRLSSTMGAFLVFRVRHGFPLRVGSMLITANKSHYQSFEQYKASVPDGLRWYSFFVCSPVKSDISQWKTSSSSVVFGEGCAA